MALNKICLKGNPNQEEFSAGGTITPGQLIMLNSSNQVVRHNLAGGNVDAFFAIEDSLQGNEIGDDYSSTNRVQCVNCVNGDEIYAILAPSQTITIGDYLESNGDGNLREHAVDSGTVIYTKTIVAKAKEAVTTTGSVARIRVQIV